MDNDSIKALVGKGIELYDTGNHEDAFPIFDNAARQGDPVAQYFLGIILFYGQGTNVDWPQALLWFYEAAQANITPAKAMLGFIYLNAKGVEHDIVKAVSRGEKLREYCERAFTDDVLRAGFERAKNYQTTE